jgi:hypothetical protein
MHGYSDTLFLQAIEFNILLQKMEGIYSDSSREMNIGACSGIWYKHVVVIKTKAMIITTPDCLN